MERLEADKRRRLLDRNLAVFCLLVMTQSAFAFAIPSIVGLWQRCGLGPEDYLMLQVLFGLVLALLNVPTGALADRIGRRNSLFVGCILQISGEVVYLLAESFWPFVLGEALLGIGLAFVLGADEALVYATVQELNPDKRGEDLSPLFRRAWGRIARYSLWASAGFTLVGGAAAELHERLPLALSCLTALGGMPLVLLLKESREQSRQRATTREISVFARGLFGREVRELRMYIVFPAFLAAFSQVGVWFYQPLMLESGLSAIGCGLAFAAFNLIAGWSAAQARHSDAEHRGEMMLFMTPLLVVAGSYVLMWLCASYAGFLFVLFQQWVRGYYGLGIFPARLNRAIDAAEREHLRATILSVRGLAFQALYIPGLLLARVLVGDFGTGGTLALLGAATLLLGIALGAVLGAERHQAAVKEGG